MEIEIIVRAESGEVICKETARDFGSAEGALWRLDEFVKKISYQPEPNDDF